MARDLTAGMITEFEASSLSPIFLIKAEFDSGDVRFWTGYNEITFDSEIYTGSGTLLDIQEVTETQELVANSMDIVLNGIPSSLVSLALTEPYQGRPLSVWFGALDSSGAVVSDPYLVFKGKMDIMAIEDDGETAKIAVSSESDLIGLRDSKERRYTDEDQKAEYPGDKGFEFVALSQDITLSWGAGRTD
jgi:hypothetical protein